MRGKILLLCCLLLISISSALAQSQTLTYGEPLSVEFTEDTRRYRFTFDGEANDEIYITAFTVNWELVLSLQLFGPNGTPLGQAEGNALGSVIGPVSLASTGRYTVEVTQPEWNLGVNGTVKMMVDRATLTPVKPDGRYSGVLPTAGSVVFFAYNGPAQELFGYTAAGSNIGFFMRTPQGEDFIENYYDDNFNESLRVLPVGGQYIAYIQTANEGGTEYALNLTPINVVRVQPGESVSGRLNAGSAQVFRFTSQVDELWRIDAVLPEAPYDSYLEIRSGGDLSSTITSDYSSGVDGSPRIDPFISPSAGEYYVILETETDSDYTLMIEPSPVIRLEHGVAHQGSVTQETGAVTYIYFGIADEAIRVTLENTSRTGQPGMSIYSPDDELLSFFARSRGKSTFELILPQTGLYRFTIREASYSMDAVLDFTLTLEAIP